MSTPQANPTTERAPLRIYLATGNAHKVTEIETMLRQMGAPCELLSAKAIGGMPEVDENADTFAGNARLKAEALRTQAGATDYVLADDSGLVVDALGGAPGIYSARFAGADATDAANNALLLKKLAHLPPAERKAAFICCFCLLGPATDEIFNGRCEGTITDKEYGEYGFGYDPLFAPEGYEKTFGQLGKEIKNSISHRTLACRALAAFLRQKA